jgi:hypothetical protein
MLTKRLQRLSEFIQGLRTLPSLELKSIVCERRYPVLLREAALRWLVHLAPTEVTHGAPFAERRRLVRRHHGV